jgi:mono/diheme cytochrome c family protein
MKKILIVFLWIGFLSACGTQPASSTGEAVSPTNAPPAADAAVPATEAPVPTEVVSTAPPTEASAQTAAVSFVNDVLPILQSRCANCHGGERTQEGLNLTTYANLMAGSENGSVIAPGNADTSKLAELIVSQKMPKRGPQLTPPQIQIILDWINQGALDN